MNTRLFWFPALVAGLATFAGCGGEKAQEHKTLPAVQARILVMQEETVPTLLEVPGTVQPRDRVSLSSQINGFVQSITVQPGDTVAAGQLLATLDAREAESQRSGAEAGIREAEEGLAEARKAEQMSVSHRDAARANARLASETCGRFEKLFEARSVSPQELDEVRARRDAAAAELAARETAVGAAQRRIGQLEARLAQAAAQLRRADVLVGWTSIKAPSAGRVVERATDPGSAIFPGSPLLVLESVSAPQVIADIPSAQAGTLRQGLPVRILTESGAPTEGRVTEIVPVSSAGSHTVRFKADLPASSHARSGSFARVFIPAGERQTLLLPASAVRSTGQLTAVFVADGGSKARSRLVKTAPFDADRIEVLSGLASGERVVLNPDSQIADGVPLEIRS